MFAGLNTSVSGLLASQRGLYTTNHNINNSGTPGYSRQSAEQSASRARRVAGIGFMGTGTEITDITRARDAFVDQKYWYEMGVSGEWSSKNDSIMELQGIMGEPSESSFNAYMNDFYTSLEDMTKNPGDPSFRQPVIENAMSWTKHLNEVSGRIQKMEEDVEMDIQIKVDELNSLADQVVKLNKQIYTQEIDGKSANDLRDRREHLVDRMSTIANVSVSDYSNGKFDISIGGTSLVNHNYSNEIIFDKNAKNLDDMLTWENDAKLQLRSGELKGLTDFLTGNGKAEDENGEKGKVSTYRGIPFYKGQLDNFAVEFAKKFNKQHEKGLSLIDEDGYKTESFFIFTNGDYEDGDSIIYDDKNENYKNGSASTITINPNILRDPDKLAAGAGEEDGGTGSVEDARNIHELIKQREDGKFFDSDEFPMGTPDDYINSMLASMGVDGLQTERFTETQKLMQLNLETKRESISGVSMNEEMANLIKYQHVYRAASTMINTFDSLLDLTVNRLGMVGR